MTTKDPRSRGLGRGLSALMSDVLAQDQPSPPAATPLSLPIESLRTNPDQPRKVFDPAALAELAASIRAKGVVQPIIVRTDPGAPGLYQIVAGERRWRASQQAGLHEVPVIIRTYADIEVLEIALIENIQRSDLNPVDEGQAYRTLLDRFGHTQDQLAEALGKSRSHIANQMRLLQLPESVLDFVKDGRLTAGHARPLIGHPRAHELALHIVNGGLSVRAAENLARTGPPRTTAPKANNKDADTLQIEAELSAILKMRVTIDHRPNGQGGKMTIHYGGIEQLDNLLRALSGQ
jgi:ParB family transcriptional regulator, chromosome partitioning protein